MHILNEVVSLKLVYSSWEVIRTNKYKNIVTVLSTDIYKGVLLDYWHKKMFWVRIPYIIRLKAKTRKHAAPVSVVGQWEETAHPVSFWAVEKSDWCLALCSDLLFSLMNEMEHDGSFRGQRAQPSKDTFHHMGIKNNQKNWKMDFRR